MLADALDGEARSGPRCARRARRHAAAFPWRGRTAAPRARSVSALELYAQCPVQVLRAARPAAGRGARRRRGAVAARARTPAPRAVRGDLRRVAVARARHGDARTARRGTRAGPRDDGAHLSRLSPVDAALERTRLVGSPVAAGLIDVVLRLEAERPTEVVERRLEHAHRGVYQFALLGWAARDQSARHGRPDRPVEGRHVSRPRLQGLPAGLDAATGALRDRVRQRLGGYRGRDWAAGRGRLRGLSRGLPSCRSRRGPRKTIRRWPRQSAASSESSTRSREGSFHRAPTAGPCA